MWGSKGILIPMMLLKEGFSLKALFLVWSALAEIHVESEFIKRGIQVTRFEFENSNVETRVGKDLADKLVNALMAEPYSFCFSFNYVPVAAMAAAACRIKYISWVYDSPLNKMYQASVTLPTNYLFVFDRGACLDLQRKGVETVRHMPLGAAVDFYDSLPAIKELKSRHSCDISFVGKFYDEPDINYFKHLERLSEYSDGFVEALVKAQQLIYGDFFLERALTTRVVQDMAVSCLLAENPGQFESLAWTYANYFLALKVSSNERHDVISKLKGLGKIHVYTPNPGLNIEGARNMGIVDSTTEQPYVFKNSRINLNISSKSIITGIPMRLWDIIGCGGFAISNYQEELLDFFVPGENIIYYENTDDCREKCKYYLKHPTERLEIARRAYEFVKDKHTYGHRVDAMLNIVLN